MRFYNLFIAFGLLLILNSCGEKNQDANSLFSIEIKENKKGFTTEKSLVVSVKNKKNNPIENITYKLGYNSEMKVEGNKEVTFPLSEEKMGQHIITAEIVSDGGTFKVTKEISILASETPKLYSYRILETYPHDIEAYTQGLEFHGDTLYESTGLRQFSSLRKTDYKNGNVIEKVALKDQYFGEGLTILNDKIYQLTWQSGQGFIYDLKTMKELETFKFNESKEGWGLANDGKTIYKSDGTEKIWTLNPKTLAEESFIEIYTNTSKIKSVNELEFVEGDLYANVYQSEAIAIVNPKNGAVKGVINLKGLKDNVTQHDALDVLNGIAYKGEKNILYVTGKKWDKLFKIEIFLK